MPLFFCIILSSKQAGAEPVVPVAGAPVPAYNLGDCLQMALDRNPGILKAQKDIERTEGLIITAKSTLYPQIYLSGRAEERNDDLFSQGNDVTIQRFRDYWTVRLTATQSIYSGGVNRQQIAIAKLQHEAAIIQLQALINQVLNKVKHAVYAIVVKEAEIEAEQQTIKLLTDEESHQKALFDAGRATRFSILRTQVNLSNQNSALIQSRNELMSWQIRLAQLMGMNWSHNKNTSAFSAPFQLRQNLEYPVLNQINVEKFIELALSRRPELKILERQIDISERKIKIDKAANIPRFDLYAADEERRDQNRASFSNSVNDYAVGVLGSWNIFDGFAGKGQAMADNAALLSNYVSRDETRLKIESEVREAYASLITAQTLMNSQSVNVRTAEESIKLAQVSAETGYATLLDVLQSTMDLSSARLQAIRTKQLYLDALADLEFAVSLKFVDWPGNEETRISPSLPQKIKAAP